MFFLWFFLAFYYVWDESQSKMQLRTHVQGRKKGIWLRVADLKLRRYRGQKQVSELKLLKGSLLNSGLIEVEDGGRLHWRFLKEDSQEAYLSADSARAVLTERNFVDLWQTSSIKKIELLKQAQIVTGNYNISGSHIFYYPQAKLSKSKNLVTIKRGSSQLSAKKGFKLNIDTGGASLFGPIYGVLQNYDRR